MVMKFDRDTQILIQTILDTNVSCCCNNCDDVSQLELREIGEQWDSNAGSVTKIDQDLSRDFNLDYNTVWMIFKIRDRYFRLTGWKSSYGVPHWNNYMEEVERKEETRVFYE